MRLLQAVTGHVTRQFICGSLFPELYSQENRPKTRFNSKTVWFSYFSKKSLLHQWYKLTVPLYTLSPDSLFWRAVVLASGLGDYTSELPVVLELRLLYIWTLGDMSRKNAFNLQISVQNSTWDFLQVK